MSNHKDSRPPPASIRGLRKAGSCSHNPYESIATAGKRLALPL